uniref:F-box domain-containing protein n=1 Tax=Physcomitrium patens TaxID=3218 RepID=A0A2K1K1L7_PHYPA|nr:hypothetical protein PHYPA_012135 [Physcomitrium patens]
METKRELGRPGSGTGLSYETLACVLKFDRTAVSLVCQQWRRVVEEICNNGVLILYQS